MHSLQFAAALLPVLALARPNPVAEMYTVNIAGQETAFDLPPWTGTPPEPLPTQDSPLVPEGNLSDNPATLFVPMATEGAEGAEAGEQPAAPAETGTTIPIPIGGQETSIVLPYFETQTAVVPVIVAPTSEASSAISSVAQSVEAAAESITSEASAAISAIASSITAEASSAVDEAYATVIGAAVAIESEASSISSEIVSEATAAATSVLVGAAAVTSEVVSEVTAAVSTAVVAVESVTSAVVEEVTSVASSAAAGASSIFVIVADDGEEVTSAVGAGASSVASEVASAVASVSSAVDVVGGAIVIPTGLDTSFASTITAAATTLYGAYSLAESAASSLVVGAANITVTVAAPTGGFATFTVPAEGDFNPTATRPAIFTGAAAPQYVKNSGMAGLMAGLVAVLLA